jgi:hypothetical protein
MVRMAQTRRMPVKEMLRGFSVEVFALPEWAMASYRSPITSHS